MGKENTRKLMVVNIKENSKMMTSALTPTCGKPNSWKFMGTMARHAKARRQFLEERTLTASAYAPVMTTANSSRFSLPPNGALHGPLVLAESS